jgi:hypothetical protein
MSACDVARKVVLMAGITVCYTSGVHAQVMDSICDELKGTRPGEYVHGQAGEFLTTATLRHFYEPINIGRSAVKGAMASRLSSDLEGARVRWSNALLKGPVACGSFNAYQVLVDPMNVRILNE